MGKKLLPLLLTLPLLLRWVSGTGGLPRAAHFLRPRGGKCYAHTHRDPL